MTVRSGAVAIALLMLASILQAQEDLRLELVRHSLTGTHYRYRQYLDGLPVAGGEVDLTVGADGSLRESIRAIARPPDAALTRRSTADLSLVLFNDNGALRFVRRVEVTDGMRRTIRYEDPETHAVIREEPQYAMVKAGRVLIQTRLRN